MKNLFRIPANFHVFLSILIICLSFLFTCSDDDHQTKEEGPIQLDGVWDILPSDTHSSLDFDTKSGYAILRTDLNLEGFLSSESKEFILLSDGKGVRIQSESDTVPTGYFLFQDRKKEVWLGLWKEELVRLILVK